jgi:transcriptional regulator with XRE-family HTH domain
MDDASLPRHVPLQPYGRIAGCVIRARRVELNMTQEDLVAESGIDISFVSRLERGLTQPSVGVLIRLAASLQISASELMEKIEQRLPRSSLNGSREQ